jgi:hypothetical protein
MDDCQAGDSSLDSILLFPISEIFLRLFYYVTNLDKFRLDIDRTATQNVAGCVAFLSFQRRKMKVSSNVKAKSVQ